MDDWDAQKMLDKYIHDYMIKKNLLMAAEIFAEEADICLKPVAVNPPDGFLTEWWSLFWDVYSAKLPKHPEGMKDSSNKNVRSVLQRPSTSYVPLPVPGLPNMLQNVYPTTKISMPDMGSLPQDTLPTLMPTTDMRNFLQGALPTIEARRDTGKLLQGALPAMMPRPKLNFNALELPPMLGITIDQGQPVRNWITKSMPEQEHLMPSTGDLNFHSCLLNVDRLALMPSVSIKSSYQPKGVSKKPQPSVFENGRSCTHFESSAAIQPMPREALKLKQPKTEPTDAGSSTSSNSATSATNPASKTLC